MIAAMHVECTQPAHDAYGFPDCPECRIGRYAAEHIGVSDRELLERVLVELKEVRREHNETVAKVNAFLEGLAPHLEQIAPMIDALAQNPMFRMLAGGGKKKEKQ